MGAVTSRFDLAGHVLILGTIAFTVYGQLILKQQMAGLPPLPSGFAAFPELVRLILTRPLIFSGLAAAFVASLFWMAAIQRFPLSYAYPFMSLTYVLVFGLAYFFFGDAMNASKIGGLFLICTGVALIARGG